MPAPKLASPRPGEQLDELPERRRLPKENVPWSGAVSLSVVYLVTLFIVSQVPRPDAEHGAIRA
jgi:hypothetical protein